MAEQINKDRLNELLGIQEGQTFEDYLGEATQMDDAQTVIDQTQKMLQETKQKVDEIEGQFKENQEVIDQAQSQIQKYGVSSLAEGRRGDEDGSASVRIDNLVNVENAFKSIEDLVDTTKQMLGTVYGIISSCDVLDSETVGAAAALIGETRQLISEYTSLYKQRVKFFDNVKMEMLKQQHRIELLKMKEESEKRRWEMTHSAPAQAEVVQGNGNIPSGMVEAGPMDMLKLLEDLDKEDEDKEEDEETT